MENVTNNTASSIIEVDRKENKMTLTIYKGSDTSYVLIGSKDERFAEAWGGVVKVPTNHLYEQLSDIAKWANNDIGEECLFEID
jgi:hypothetical protein